jgi:hypothetical protein
VLLKGLLKEQAGPVQGSNDRSLGVIPELADGLFTESPDAGYLAQLFYGLGEGALYPA